MTLVVDASVVIAALGAVPATAEWADDVLAGHDLVAPSLMPVEVASTFRRAVAGGVVSADRGALVLADLHDLPIEYHPPMALLGRIWELRHTVSVYDAWYVALAEALDAPLATLDLRLVRSPGPRCTFVTP